MGAKANDFSPGFWLRIGAVLFVAMGFNGLMGRALFQLGVAALFLGILSGCVGTHPASGPEALAHLPDAPVTVWVSEPDLAKKIRIRDQKVEQGVNGALVARVEVVNVSGALLEVDVKTFYKDMAGWTLNQSPWVRHRLSPGRVVWMMAPTIAPGTSRFFIQIQPAAPGKPAAGLGLIDI